MSTRRMIRKDKTSKKNYDTKMNNEKQDDDNDE